MSAPNPSSQDRSISQFPNQNPPRSTNQQQRSDQVRFTGSNQPGPRSASSHESQRHPPANRPPSNRNDEDAVATASPRSSDREDV